MFFFLEVYILKMFGLVWFVLQVEYLGCLSPTACFGVDNDENKVSTTYFTSWTFDIFLGRSVSKRRCSVFNFFESFWRDVCLWN